MYLDNIGKKYTIKETIGGGGYGAVFRCIRKDDQKEFAIKKIEKSLWNIKTFIMEFSIYENIEHPNIPKLIDWSDDKTHVYMILPLYDPWNFIRKKSIYDFISDFFSAIIIIHENKIYHGDIKTYNIVYDKINDRYLVIDFGISRYSDGCVTQISTTPPFEDPEYVYYKYNRIESELYPVAITICDFYCLYNKLPVKNKLIKTNDDKLNRILDDLTIGVDHRLSCLEIAKKYKINVVDGFFSSFSPTIKPSNCTPIFEEIVTKFLSFKLEIKSQYIFTGIQIFKVLYQQYQLNYGREMKVNVGLQYLYNCIYLISSLYFDEQYTRVKKNKDGDEFLPNIEYLLIILSMVPNYLHPKSPYDRVNYAEELKQFIPTLKTCTSTIRITRGGTRYKNMLFSQLIKL